MFKKIVIITAIVFTLLISFPTSAAGTDSQIPELNPFCWHRIDCHNTRKQFLTGAPSCTAGDPLCKELEQGFISNASVAPCVGGEGETQWGRCLPAGTTKTEISFGGKSEFSNIGEFIVLMYKYMVTIASIVAVVMIIIAGMQWVTSGGNSEAISSAKKRIGGAIIGLFIAYMSYFVLNTINPALVNLRLPQVWLIKPVAMMPEYCSDLPGASDGKLKFAIVAGADEPNLPLPPRDQRIYKALPTAPLITCGQRFLAENGGDSTCLGNLCPVVDNNQQTCFDKEGDGTSYKCGNVKIAGKITYTGSYTAVLGDFLGATFSSDWKHPPANRVILARVCEVIIHEEGSYLVVSFSKEVKNADKYFIEATSKQIEKIPEECADNFSGNPQDYVLVVEMQGAKGGAFTYREWHYLGKNGVDLGNWKFFRSNFDKIDPKYFISQDDLLKGVRMNIDGDSIINVQAGGWVSGLGVWDDTAKQNKADSFYQTHLIKEI